MAFLVLVVEIVILIAFLLFFALAFLVWIFTTKVTGNEIMTVLDIQRWKTGMEIKKELKKAKGIPEEKWWRDISGSLYWDLDKLEEKGRVESRKRENIPEEQLVLRKGVYPREYRLTNKTVV